MTSPTKKSSQKARRGVSGVAKLSDVARLASVSPMTVSRVINGVGNVRANKRQKVEAAIAELRYVPNLAAQSLAGAGVIRIGLLYSNPSAAYLSRFLLGGLEQARSSNAQLILENCESSEDAATRIEVLIASGAKGIILTPPLCDDRDLLSHMEDLDIPACIVANWDPHGSFAVIRIDDFRASQEMTEHLIAQGHRRIGFIKGDPQQKGTEERFKGYCAALAEAGISFDSEIVGEGQFTFQSGLQAAEKLLSLTNRPTAIFASNDDMAAGVMTVAHQQHLDLPADLSICGFDDTDFASTIWPQLTTIHQPIAEMASAAVTTLVMQIRRGGSASRELLFSHQLIKRESDTRLT